MIWLSIAASSLSTSRRAASGTSESPFAASGHLMVEAAAPAPRVRFCDRPHPSPAEA